MRGFACAVRFTERMAACNQRDGLFVVHAHVAKGSADRRRRRQRFTAGVWPFGVNVNQAHFSGRKRALRQRFRVTVGQPAFSSPQFTSRSGSQTSSRPAPKPKVRKPEFSSATLPARINRSAQRFLSVFLLNWPQQTASLIRADVIRPSSAAQNVAGRAPRRRDRQRSDRYPHRAAIRINRPA